MVKPTWFDSSNQILDISAQPTGVTGLNPIVRSLGGLERLRSLWLLSFVQDMGTFMSNTKGLAHFVFIQQALLVLQNDRGQSSEQKFMRLACLLGICVVLQASMPHEQSLASLESLLDDKRESWSGSVNGLYSTLCEVLDPQKNEYVLNMTGVLSAISHEARKGVEACLLQMLRQGTRDHLSTADDITPDVLLSSLHGQ